MALLVPIALFVVVYFVYRSSSSGRTSWRDVDGPPITGNGRVQVLWIVRDGRNRARARRVWGSYTLVRSAPRAPAAARARDPLRSRTGYKTALPVQVIGQQWAWTFRYPTYGGVETRELAHPRPTGSMAFHVTSLDVTHSFWAYELGVKADAVPGVDNVAYVHPAHARPLPDPLRRALRPLARPHARHGRRRRSRRPSRPWIAAAQKTANAADVKYLRRTAAPTSRRRCRRAG